MGAAAVKVINPSGRVVDVSPDHPCVELAEAGRGGWKLASTKPEPGPESPAPGKRKGKGKDA